MSGTKKPTDKPYVELMPYDDQPAKITIDEIVKGITIFTSMLILWGIVSGIYYYDSFGINIINYIDLRETVFLFVDLNATLFTFAALGYIVSQFSPTPIKAYKNNNAEEKKASTWHIKWKYVITILILLFFVFAFPPTLEPTLLVAALGLFSKISVLAYSFFLLEKYRHPFFIKYFSQIALLSITLVLCIGLSVINAALKLREPSKLNLEIINKDNTKITTTKDTLYIGKSNNFSFFFIKSLHSAFIIKNEEIKSTIIKPSN